MKLKINSQAEVSLVNVEEHLVTPKDIKKLVIDVNRTFKGSNLSEIYGYSPYNITCSLEAILTDKEKRVNKKRIIISKNLEVDAKFYKMSKKKNVS